MSLDGHANRDQGNEGAARAGSRRRDKAQKQRAALESSIRRAHEQGDYEAAITSAINLYGNEIYSWLVAVMRDMDKADDVYSDFVERVWQYVDRFRWQSSFRTWAYVLVRSAMSAYYRKPDNKSERKRHVSSLLGLADRDDDRRQPLPVSISRLQQQTRDSTKVWLKTEVKDAFVALRQQALTQEEEEILIFRVNRKMKWKDVALVVVDPKLTENELEKAADRLKQRFITIKKKLRRAAEAEGLLPGTSSPT